MVYQKAFLMHAMSKHLVGFFIQRKMVLQLKLVEARATSCDQFLNHLFILYYIKGTAIVVVVEITKASAVEMIIFVTVEAVSHSCLYKIIEVRGL